MHPLSSVPNMAGRGWLQTVLDSREADLRAHQVALTYAVYASRLDEIIHGNDAVARKVRRREPVEWCNANWFHFATWGTVTIARNIAHQRAPQRVDDLLPLALRRRLTPAVIRERAASGQRVGRALAWGQRLIFLTATFAFQDFEEAERANQSGDFTLKRGTADRIAELSKIGGEDQIGRERHLVPLEKAFTLYRRAREAPARSGIQARLVLGANVLLTAMEQDLAQRAVATVIEHVPKRLVSRAERRLAKSAERWTGVPRQIVELQLPFRYHGLRTFADTAWSRLMTDQVLVMALPTETLRLGRDIPPRDPAQPFYPWAVRHVDRMPEDPECRVGPAPPLPLLDPGTGKEDDLQFVANLVRSFDRTQPDGTSSAAQDWRRFDDRMNWAVALMRSRQQDDSLFWPPYSREDEDRIRNAKLPVRSGDPSEFEVQAPFDFSGPGGAP